MKFIQIIPLLVLTVTINSCSQPPNKPSGKDALPANSLLLGKLLIEPSVLHHKVSASVRQVEFAYQARNMGEKAITITHVDSGCACIEESASPERVKPGETSTIRAVYDTKKVNGLVEKILTVATDQPNVSEALLKVQLEVEPIYLLEPKSISWQLEQETESQTQWIDFKVQRDKLIHILATSVSNNNFTAELKEVVKGKHYQIGITPNSIKKRQLGFVRITTDCELSDRSTPVIYLAIKP